MNADIVVEMETPLATVALLHGATEAGAEWLNEHTPADAQRWCGRVVCEHRFVADIVAGARADGLTVEADTAAEIPARGGAGWPGPCPDGMDWSDWLAANNLD